MASVVEAASTKGQGTLPGHAHGLDLVRLAAALLVALFHFTWMSPRFAWLLPVGWIGVPVFFVLSGLVIANSASGASPRTFLVRRFLRLYPTAWICLAISVAAILAAGQAVETSGLGAQLSPGRVVSSVLLFGNVFIVSAYWSLPLEIAFYALVALVLAARGPTGIVPLGRGLIVWSGLFLSLRLAAEFGLFSAERLDLGYGLRNVTLLRHGHYFGLGIVLFALARDRALRPHLPWIAAACLLAIVEIAWRAEHFVARQGHLHDVFAVTLASAAIWGLLCLAMVASVLVPATIGSGAWARPIRSIGLATYPFYLLHEVVGGAVLGSLVATEVGAGVQVLLAIGVALAVSLVVAELVEPRLRVLLRGRLLRPRPA